MVNAVSNSKAAPFTTCRLVIIGFLKDHIAAAPKAICIRITTAIPNPDEYNDVLPSLNIETRKYPENTKTAKAPTLCK